MCRFMVYTMSVCRGERSELPLFGRAKRAPPVAQVGGEPYGKRIDPYKGVAPFSSFTPGTAHCQTVPAGTMVHAKPKPPFVCYSLG